MKGHPGKGAAGERKIVAYGDCKCVLSRYCDGGCNPIFADEAASKAGAAKVKARTVAPLKAGRKAQHEEVNSVARFVGNLHGVARRPGLHWRWMPTGPQGLRLRARERMRVEVHGHVILSAEDARTLLTVASLENDSKLVALYAAIVRVFEAVNSS